MDTHLTDQMVEDAAGEYGQADLPPATKVALELADVLTSDKPIVSPEFHQKLSEHFTQEQILELGSALAVASGWQRFIEAFGIRPDPQTFSTQSHISAF